MKGEKTKDEAERQVSGTYLQERLAELAAVAEELESSGSFAKDQDRISQIDEELAKGWDQIEDPAALQRERTRLQGTTAPLLEARKRLAEAKDLLSLALEERDEALLDDIGEQLGEVGNLLDQVELSNMLSYPHADGDAYVDIQFGSGGIESQDWAQMLKRMYVGYAASQGWKSSTVEETPGEAGIKSATLLVEGLNAYGMLRTETGVHRMVRKSPYDANHRRHTTFASVFVYPVLPESEEVEVNPSDLRVDTYRASGAGGQHVNTTDSAVRITHLPSGIVVQCQNSRSQHKNRATAMSMLRSRLQLMRKAEEEAEKQKIEAGKADISWGSQIRSYVLDQSRVKDIRTGVESGNPNAVLDGDGLHRFIEASLRRNAGV